MYNPSELSVGLNPNKRWIRAGLFILIAGIGGLRIYEGITESRNAYLLMGAAFDILALIGMLQIWRYRVTLGDAFIEQSNAFTSHRLAYTEVLRVRERKRHLILQGPTESIRIQPDTDQIELVTKKISERLNALPVLRTEGNLTKWGIADRDDEGRLARR